MEKKSVNIINNTVSKYTDIEVQDILGKSRKEEIVDARFMAIYILFQRLNISCNTICECYGITKQAVSHAHTSFLDRTRNKLYLNIAFKNTLKELAELGIIDK